MFALSTISRDIGGIYRQVDAREMESGIVESAVEGKGEGVLGINRMQTIT